MRKEKGITIKWEEVHALKEGIHDNPHHILGPHLNEQGLVINAYIKDALKVEIISLDEKKQYEMLASGIDNFYTLPTDEKKKFLYKIRVTYRNGNVYEYIDSYQFEPVLDAMDINTFQNGIHYNIYDRLGAHKMKIDGVEGILFAVWAPRAKRVSVVGDFNLWDGSRHPMRKLPQSGIYELFIPEANIGDLYKFEIRGMDGDVFMKADPYGNSMELRPGTASIVTDLNQYKWKDTEWTKQRKKVDCQTTPVNIYEIHLASWKRPDEENKEFYNYREIAPMLAEYVKEMGYTHVELMPIMEHPYDPSWGYQVIGYYAPTARYGTPEDFMYFMDYMHQQGIGVILDWVPAHFPRDAAGLRRFDGTATYEDSDPRKGQHPDWGTMCFNYNRKEVSNFLIANALFWAEKYHVDGIRMDAVASMLYLDYGRKDGEWVANMYGGNENLEALEFLKHLNSIFKKKYPDVLLIAEESTAWPYITRSVEDDGVGFDFKWNMGWMNDFLDYMRTDPLFRKGKHSQLTFSLYYAYSENYVLVLSHDEVVYGKGSMIQKMPGAKEEKFANLRVAYGFMMTHPGKKLLFMGQEFAQYKEFDEASQLSWELLDVTENKMMQEYVKDLNMLYRQEKALYEIDNQPESFEWIDFISSDESIVVYIRRGKKKEDTLVAVCNFTPVTRENYKIGVPYKGKYKEIFNSDAKKYGGKGFVNGRMKQSKKEECDERENSISMIVPPLGISIFKYIPTTPVKKAKKVTETNEKSSEKTVSEKKTVNKKAADKNQE